MSWSTGRCATAIRRSAPRIDALTAQGCDRLLVVPLYPQYSAATSATVCDEVFRVLGGMRAQPTLRVTPPYYDDPDYIEALAVSIDAHLATLPFQPEIIVASFHGMPQKYIDKGDPYQAQCIATTDALRKRMGLDATKLLLTFQSRFGFDAWLQPYTDKTIEQLAKDGVRSIAVVTPGFSADCLETLEEIAQENAESSSIMAASSLPDSLPERQRSRHGRHPPAGAARASGLDIEASIGLSLGGFRSRSAAVIWRPANGAYLCFKNSRLNRRCRSADK